MGAGRKGLRLGAVRARAREAHSGVCSLPCPPVRFTMTSRRDFLRTGTLASAAVVAGSALPRSVQAADVRPEPLATHSGSPVDAASDEAYWRLVAAQYRVADKATNMEAGYFGMMAAPVLAAHHAHIDRVNRENSVFARREFSPIMNEARRRTAEALAVIPDELVFSRGATEALQALIGQYKGVTAGDTVMYADLDYGAMQWAMDALAARRGATVATLNIPEPATYENILAEYSRAFDAHPRTKLLLLTHCNNKTGLIHPVRAITEIAKARGIDVIVDAAHSFGQVPLALSDFGADFIGLNLHKWIGAPVGVGAMYVRAGRLDALERAHGDQGSEQSITSRLHTGTMNFANVMTVPDALDFQATIGIPNKAARLRYLRDAWVSQARDIPGVDVLTPDDDRLVGAITGFRLNGQTSREANAAIVGRLFNEFGIFTVARNGIAGGDCVRVTPMLYNTPADADKLVSALRVMAAR